MQFISEHQFGFFLLVAYFVFSAVVDGMPEPVKNSSLTYQWAYATLHYLAGAVKTAFTKSFQSQGEDPNEKSK